MSPATPTREIYWNIPNHLYIYALEPFLIILLAIGVWIIIASVNRGTGKISLLPLKIRAKQMAVYVWAHKKLRRKPAGYGHLIIFYGFILLTIGTTLVFIQVATGIYFLKGWFYLFFSLVLDIAGAAALAALTVALLSRTVSARLKGFRGDAWMAFLLWLIILTGFMVEGMRIESTSPQWAVWSPVGLLFGMTFDGIEQPFLLLGHKVMWWFHLAISFIFLALIPYSRLRHILTGAAIHLTKVVPPVLKLSTPNLDEAETFGASIGAEFSRRDLLDSQACTACGRCDEVCPAKITGKPLQPRKIVTDLQFACGRPEAYLVETENSRERQRLPAIGDEELWACTSCAACHDACPMFIEPITKIIEMRRHLSMSEGRYPGEVTSFYRNEETNSNPWGLGWEKRADWAKDLDVPIAADKKEFEYLFWVGCAGSYDGRYRKVSESFARILNSASVDYAILGNEEKCNGDPLRRLGNEYQFQMLAEENVENFKKYGVKKLVTTCPHCYNIFKNEYRDFGFEAEVIHHSQMIGSLMNEGKLPKPDAGSAVGSTVFHDSCYLGRYNSLYDEPRRLVGDGHTDPPRSRENGFCCGAGGGRMWMEEKLGDRINITRAGELIAQNPSTIATSCPFCMTMLTDGVKAKGKLDEVPVKDIAEIFSERHLTGGGG
ncbi:MAG: (Fe-S)-binding protein [Nitrospinota bacterium]